MEKYFSLLILTTPGLIARFVAKCLGGKQSKRGEFETIMGYFSYSFFSLSLTLVVTSFLGMFSFNEEWAGLEKKFSIPWFCVQFGLISFICSIFVGASWQLRLEKEITRMFNFINEKAWGNSVFLSGTLFHQLFDDGKDHYIVIEKGDKEIAAGFYGGCSFSNQDRMEISVNMHPNYNRPDDSTIRNVYLDVTSGTVIKKFDVPVKQITSPALELVEAEVAAAEPV